MKKIYFVLGVALVLGIASCGTNTTEEESTTEESGEYTKGAEGSSGQTSETALPAKTIETYVNDKSGISANDIDVNDTSYISRTKTLYNSEENGKTLAVVYGFKRTDNGMAIIELQGETPVRLKQSKPRNGDNVEFTNGSITLIRNGKSVVLDESGEKITYTSMD